MNNMNELMNSHGLELVECVVNEWDEDLAAEAFENYIGEYNDARDFATTLIEETEPKVG